jgi:hypothetical protein
VSYILFGASSINDQARLSIKAYPFSAINVPIRSIETGTETHEQHIQSVRYVDDGPIRVICSRHFRHSRQDGRGRYGREEATERYDRHDDSLSTLREAVVDLVRVTRHNIADICHVMVTDGGDCLLQLKPTFFRNDGGVLRLLFRPRGVGSSRYCRGWCI